MAMFLVLFGFANWSGMVYHNLLRIAPLRTGAAVHVCFFCTCSFSSIETIFVGCLVTRARFQGNEILIIYRSM